MTLPILLWPMMREFKFLFAYYEDPSIELQMPWASAQEKKRRTSWRVLVIATVFLLGMLLLIETMVTEGSVDRWWLASLANLSGIFFLLMEILPTFFMSLLSPATISIFAVIRHRSL